MRWRDVHFVVTKAETVTFDSESSPLIVGVTAEYGDGNKLSFLVPADYSMRVGDVVTVSMEWGECNAD